jgi:hypothetical protein
MGVLNPCVRGLPRGIVRGSSTGFDHESAYTTRSLAFLFLFAGAGSIGSTKTTWWRLLLPSNTLALWKERELQPALAPLAFLGNQHGMNVRNKPNMHLFFSRLPDDFACVHSNAICLGHSLFCFHHFRLLLEPLT